MSTLHISQPSTALVLTVSRPHHRRRWNSVLFSLTTMILLTLTALHPYVAAPTVLHESSLPDDQPMDVTTDNEVAGGVTYHIVPAGTSKNRDLLMDSNGHSYTAKPIKNTTRRYWRCLVRNKSTTCRATEENGSYQRARKFEHVCRCVHILYFISLALIFFYFISLSHSSSQQGFSQQIPGGGTGTMDCMAPQQRLRRSRTSPATYHLVHAGSSKNKDS